MNIQGSRATLNLPLKSKFAVARVDHDFASKQHFMASYRYYNQQAGYDRPDGHRRLLPGDKLGTPASLSSDPVQAWYLVAGLTTNITKNAPTTFTTASCETGGLGAATGDIIRVHAIAGLGGRWKSSRGQSQTQDLGPYNVNTQQTRTRFWDGKDQMFRDDVSMLKGNHLFQFGGTYQHNFNWHQRTDNGGGINYPPVYTGQRIFGSVLASPGHHSLSDLQHRATISNYAQKCDSLMAAALGIVSISQIAYTRSGSNLALNPPLTPAFDQSTIPYYNVYFSDTWHMKPDFHSHVRLGLGAGDAASRRERQAGGSGRCLGSTARRAAHI